MKRAYKAPAVTKFGDLMTLTQGTIGTCNDGTTVGSIGNAPGTVTLNGTFLVSGCGPLVGGSGS